MSVEDLGAPPRRLLGDHAHALSEAASASGSGVAFLTPGMDVEGFTAATARSAAHRGERVLVLAATVEAAAKIAAETGGTMVLPGSGLDGVRTLSHADLLIVPKRVLYNGLREQDAMRSALSASDLGPRERVVFEACDDSAAPGMHDLLDSLLASSFGRDGAAAAFVGVTDRPARSDGMAFHPAFHGAEIGRLTRDSALADGAIAPTRCLVPDAASVERLVRDRKGVGLVDSPETADLVVGHWEEHVPRAASGLPVPTLLYAGSVRQAAALAAAFSEAGHPAATISGGVSAKERSALMKDFAEGRLSVLAVHLAEISGPEASAVGCTLYARAGMEPSHFLKSLAPGSTPREGKDLHVVIDLVDNASRWKASRLFVDEDSSPFDPQSTASIAAPKHKPSDRTRAPAPSPRPAARISESFDAEERPSRPSFGWMEEGAESRQLPPLVRVGEESWMALSATSSTFGLLTFQSGRPFVLLGEIEDHEDGRIGLGDCRVLEALDLDSALVHLASNAAQGEGARINAKLAAAPDGAEKDALRADASARGLRLDDLAGGSAYSVSVLTAAVGLAPALASKVEGKVRSLGLPSVRPVVGRDPSAVPTAARAAAKTALSATVSTAEALKARVEAGTPILALPVSPASLGGSLRAALKNKSSPTLARMHDATRMMAALASSQPGDSHDRLELGRRVLARELASRGLLPIEAEKALVSPLTSSAGKALTQRIESERIVRSAKRASERSSDRMDP